MGGLQGPVVWWFDADSQVDKKHGHYYVNLTDLFQLHHPVKPQGSKSTMQKCEITNHEHTE